MNESAERWIFSTLNIHFYVILGEQYIKSEAENSSARYY